MNFNKYFKVNLINHLFYSITNPFLGLFLFKLSSNIQALHILFEVINPHFSHFCLFVGLLFSDNLICYTEYIISIID